MGAARFAYGGRLTDATPVRRRNPDLVADLRVWYVGGTGALIALYYAAAQLGYALDFSGPVAAIVWLPVGVGIAFLYYGGLKFWPGVVIGDLLVNNYSALPFGAALGQTFGNLLEVVTATVLLHRLIRRGPPLGTVGGVGRTVIALAVGTAISATIGSLSSLLGDVIAARSFGSVWRTWWLGDLSGALLVVPLAMAWYRPLHPGLFWRRRLEAVAALASVGGLSVLAFNSAKALAYLVFPGLIWSAVRLRARGATAAVALAAGISIWATTHYVGPFSSHSMTRSVLDTQLFITVASLTTLCLAAAVAEREALAERLLASRVRLIHAADAERQRLEHNLHDGAQQLLTGVMVRLGLLAERSREAPSGTGALIETARSELGLAIDELRELAHGNHPAVLTEEGLGAAIARIASRSSMPVEVVVELPSTPLGDAIEATAYYVLAEAVANTQKYARAKSIRLGARVSKDALEVEAADDGIGGAVETPGSGLEGLRDRVEAFGGTFELASRPGRGTEIAATFPLARSAA